MCKADSVSDITELLLDAAADLLAAHGFHGLRMIEVATRAGVSRQTVYNEFGNKEGLVQAVAAHQTEEYLTGIVTRLKENPDNFEGWMRIIRSYVVLDQRQAAEAALATALKRFPPESDNGRQLLTLAGELQITAEGSGQ